MSDQELRDKLANEVFKNSSDPGEYQGFLKGWEAARANPTATEATEEVLNTHETTLLKLRISELEDTAAQLRAEVERLEKIISSLVVQVEHGDGYYSFHKVIIWPEGHIGHDGPIVHIGEQIEQQAFAEYRAQYPKEPK